MRLIIVEDDEAVSEWAAKYIVKRINEFKPNENKYFVLGLPTGLFFCNRFRVIKVIVNFKVKIKVIVILRVTIKLRHFLCQLF